jgi:hypothetical protein
MKINVNLEFDVNLIERGASNSEIKAAIKEAVFNALSQAERNGYSHKLANYSITNLKNITIVD